MRGASCLPGVYQVEHPNGCQNSECAIFGLFAGTKGRKYCTCDWTGRNALRYALMPCSLRTPLLSPTKYIYEQDISDISVFLLLLSVVNMK